jgi:hypothetical protein
MRCFVLLLILDVGGEGNTGFVSPSFSLPVLQTLAFNALVDKIRLDFSSCGFICVFAAGNDLLQDGAVVTYKGLRK